MTLRSHAQRSLALALAASAALAMTACDDGATSTPTPTDESTLAYAGFALTADDASDDDFTAEADPAPLLDELGEALDEPAEPPAADEAEAPPEEPPGRIVRNVLVLWGKPVLDPATTAATPWAGKIVSDVAKVHALRKIQFEPGDHLVRDENPQSVTFSTVTTTHHDGVLLRIVAPRTPAALAGHIAFVSEGFTKTLPLADLLDGFHRAFAVDDAGNALIVSTVPEHRCGHGLMNLTWKRKGPRGGVFGGKVFGPDGEVTGLVAGIWGRVDGKPRFKGFFLTPERRFAGVLKGAWTPFPAAAGQDGGAFRGVWTLRGREMRGVLAGVYRMGDEVGVGGAVGHLLALCPGAAAACDADLALPAPEAPACGCEADEENADAEICECEAPPVPACVTPEPPAEATPAE